MSCGIGAAAGALAAFNPAWGGCLAGAASGAINGLANKFCDSAVCGRKSNDTDDWLGRWYHDDNNRDSSDASNIFLANASKAFETIPTLDSCDCTFAAKVFRWPSLAGGIPLGAYEHAIAMRVALPVCARSGGGSQCCNDYRDDGCVLGRYASTAVSRGLELVIY